MKKKHVYWAGTAVLALMALLVAPPFAAEKTGTSRVASVGSLRVRYHDSGEGGGVPLVFIHGWACDSSVWNRQIPFFEQTHRVVAIDLPGFGASDKPRDAQYTLDLFAEAVKAVIDAAGIERPVLIGHSMGVAVAQQFLVRYPGHARALINVDGAIRFPDDPAEREETIGMMQEVAARLSGPDRPAMMEQFLEMIFYGKTAPDIRAEIRALMPNADVYASANSMENFFDTKWWEKRTFALPSLALYADNPLQNPGLPEYLKSRYPRLDFQMWDDTGHFLMMERPERFNAVVAKYLAALR